MMDIEITEPKKLHLWLEYKRPDLQITDQEIQMLLGYFEGHDYGLFIRNDELMRKDLSEENGEIQPYDMDEVIDIVCEWNYELLYEIKENMENPRDFVDYCKNREKYDSLKRDEEMLTGLFEQTRYGKKVEQIVEGILAKGSMKGMVAMEYTVKTPVQRKERMEHQQDGKVR